MSLPVMAPDVTWQELEGLLGDDSANLLHIVCWPGCQSSNIIVTAMCGAKMTIDDLVEDDVQIPPCKDCDKIEAFGFCPLCGGRLA